MFTINVTAKCMLPLSSMTSRVVSSGSSIFDNDLSNDSSNWSESSLRLWGCGWHVYIMLILLRADKLAGQMSCDHINYDWRRNKHLQWKRSVKNYIVAGLHSDD